MGQKKVKLQKVRLVLDCNVFISAVLFSGKASQLVDLWKRAECEVLMSKDVLDEYVRVLSYPKFKLTTAEIKFILRQELIPYVKTIKVKHNFKVVSDDPTDDIYLWLAYAGKAAAIISGDQHLLKLKKFKGIKILSVNEFLMEDNQ